ncbi:MAG: PAS domain S-box protein, partial [Chloroflexi bacterium]
MEKNVNLRIGRRPNGRFFTYLVLALILFSAPFWMSSLPLQGDTHSHTLLETVATLIALIVGAMSITYYYSHRYETLLFIGAGFLGTALLDGYHALITSTFFATRLPSPAQTLIPWSWLAGRLFLGAFLLFSWLVGWLRQRWQHTQPVREWTVYMTAALATLASFAFFALYPLPSAYYPESFFHRPEELLPGFFFLLALIGYGQKGEWRRNAMEHWLLISLILGLGTQTAVMPFSNTLHDPPFNLAHLLKIASYFCIFIGLLINMFHIYRQAHTNARQLEITNAALQAEIAQREQTMIQLQQAEIRYQSLVEQIPSAVIYIDRYDETSPNKWRSTYFSPQVEHLLGYKPYELVADPDLWIRLLHPDDRTAVLNQNQQTLSPGQSISQEYRLISRNGRVLWIHDTATIIQDNNGNPPIRQGIMLDITERKIAEEKLRQAYQEMEARIQDRTAALRSANESLQTEIQERQEAVQNLSRFANQLRIAAEVSRQLSAILNPEELLEKIISLLQERFHLYHVHIYLVDDANEWLVMQIGSGEIGRQLR